MRAIAWALTLIGFAFFTSARAEVRFCFDDAKQAARQKTPEQEQRSIQRLQKMLSIQLQSKSAAIKDSLALMPDAAARWRKLIDADLRSVQSRQSALRELDDIERSLSGCAEIPNEEVAKALRFLLIEATQLRNAIAASLRVTPVPIVKRPPLPAPNPGEPSPAPPKNPPEVGEHQPPSTAADHDHAESEHAAQEVVRDLKQQRVVGLYLGQTPGGQACAVSIADQGKWMGKDGVPMFNAQVVVGDASDPLAGLSAKPPRVAQISFGQPPTLGAGQDAIPVRGTLSDILAHARANRTVPLPVLRTKELGLDGMKLQVERLHYKFTRDPARTIGKDGSIVLAGGAEQGAQPVELVNQSVQLETKMRSGGLLDSLAIRVDERALDANYKVENGFLPAAEQSRWHRNAHFETPVNFTKTSCGKLRKVNERADFNLLRSAPNETPGSGGGRASSRRH